MEEGKGRRFPLNGRQKVQQVQLNSSSYYGRASIVVQGDDPYRLTMILFPSPPFLSLKIQKSVATTHRKLGDDPARPSFSHDDGPIFQPCRKVKIRPACVLAKKKTLEINGYREHLFSFFFLSASL